MTQNIILKKSINNKIQNSQNNKIVLLFFNNNRKVNRKSKLNGMKIKQKKDKLLAE